MYTRNISDNGACWVWVRLPGIYPFIVPNRYAPPGPRSLDTLARDFGDKRWNASSRPNLDRVLCCIAPAHHSARNTMIARRVGPARSAANVCAASDAPVFWKYLRQEKKPVEIRVRYRVKVRTERGGNFADALKYDFSIKSSFESALCGQRTAEAFRVLHFNSTSRHIAVILSRDHRQRKREVRSILPFFFEEHFSPLSATTRSRGRDGLSV